MDSAKLQTESIILTPLKASLKWPCHFWVKALESRRKNITIYIAQLTLFSYMLNSDQEKQEREQVTKTQHECFIFILHLIMRIEKLFACGQRKKKASCCVFKMNKVETKKWSIQLKTTQFFI
jgi:hypothetical protein